MVEFYHQIKTLNQMAEDIRSDRYKVLALGRREAALLDFVRVDHQAMVNAEAALRVIEVSLGLPAVQRARQ